MITPSDKMTMQMLHAKKVGFGRIESGRSVDQLKYIININILNKQYFRNLQLVSQSVC